MNTHVQNAALHLLIVYDIDRRVRYIPHIKRRRKVEVCVCGGGRGGGEPDAALVCLHRAFYSTSPGQDLGQRLAYLSSFDFYPNTKRLSGVRTSWSLPTGSACLARAWIFHCFLSLCAWAAFSFSCHFRAMQRLISSMDHALDGHASRWNHHGLHVV